MEKKFDYLVFIGRMQPVTLAHMEVLNVAFEYADNVIALVGSAGEPRTLKNPFTYEERKLWIERFNADIKVAPIYDYPYNDDKWVAGVQKAVHAIAPRDAKIGLIGYSKDASSYYLSVLFPQWQTVQVKPVQNRKGLVMNATDVRTAFYESTAMYGLAGTGQIDVSDIVKLSVYEDIESILAKDETGVRLVEEYDYIKAYKKSWEVAPYPPIFVTGDAVVVQSGHVLMIKRKEAPGKGLWALPGGFVNQYERIKDGIVRELREETMLKVPEEVIKRNIKHIHMFDNPGRSDRGRVITHAAKIDLGNFPDLPHVKGADDADKAKWIPFADVRRDMCFEDHYHIISFFIGID